MPDHTPGRWEHGPNAWGNTCVWEEGAEEDPIARICSRGPDPDSDASAVEREANARLIAAAPDLLAAAEAALRYIKHCVEPSCDEGDELEDGTIHDGSTSEGNLLRAAIAKATCPKEVA